jgi:hypothetical protein
MARTLVVVVLVSLPLAPAPALAECAWVLWEMWAGNDAGEAWTAVSGEVSRERCDRAKELLYQEQVGKGAERNGRAVLWTDKKGKTWVIVSACLPDTVDPRGPKAK